MVFYCMIFMAFCGITDYQLFIKMKQIKKAVSNIILLPTATFNGIICQLSFDSHVIFVNLQGIF